MNSAIKALQSVYIALGGSLTDSYSSISDGAIVGDYNVIPDMLDAIAKIAVSKELPDVPSANGTYRLVAVKSNTGVTFNWIPDVSKVS